MAREQMIKVFFILKYRLMFLNSKISFFGIKD